MWDLAIALHTIVLLAAVFVSFTRNQGFELGSFLAAVFLSPFYLLYAIAVPYKGVRLIGNGKHHSKS